MELGIKSSPSVVRTQDYLPWWGGGVGLEEDYESASISRWRSCTQTSVRGNKKAPNPYDFTIVENRGPQLYQSFKRPDGYILRSEAGPFSSSNFFVDLETDDVYNQALEKFNERYRGSIDLSIDIAEFGQTRKMLNATTQLTDFARTLSNRFGPLKLAGGLWLQYQYGWRPILSTIAEAAERSLEVPINAMSNISAQKSMTYAQNTRVWLGGKTFGEELLNPVLTGKKFVKIHCRLTTPMKNDPARWTSLNPVSIAWELIPYSFVIDWVYDIGSYLRAYETSLLYQTSFQSGYTTEGTVYDVAINQSKPIFDGFRSLTGGSHRYRQISRKILASYPSPRAPTFKADLGSSRLLSAAALLSQHLGRR